MKEYRVVSVSMFGTFKCFNDEAAARRFMFRELLPDGRQLGPGQLSNDPVGPYRMEYRPVGSGPKDWKEYET